MPLQSINNNQTKYVYFSFQFVIYKISIQMHIKRLLCLVCLVVFHGLLLFVASPKTYDHFCSTLFLILRVWVFVVYVPAFGVLFLLWLSFYNISMDIFYWYRRSDRVPLPKSCHSMHTNTHYTWHMPLLAFFKYLRVYFEHVYPQNECYVYSKCHLLLTKYAQMRRHSYAPERWLWLFICIRVREDFGFGFSFYFIVHVL